MYSIYEVMENDTLESIAGMYNTTEEELRNINSDLNGKYIIVPNNANNIFDIYVVKGNDTIYSIAKKYNISASDLALMNGLDKKDYIYPNQKIMVPNSNTLIYITKESDTLDTVANYFNKNYNDIIEQNRNLYLLPDQLIVLKEEFF